MKRLIFFLGMLLIFPLINASDQQSPQICGGDSEFLISCLTDEQLIFLAGLPPSSVGGLNPGVVGEPSFSLRIETNYYRDGRKIFLYNEKISYNEISLDIIGKNKDSTSRIVDMKIVKVSPELEGKFPNTTETLIVRQEKLLWNSSLINVTNFENDSVLLYVGVEGTNEVLNQRFYTEVQALYTKGEGVSELSKSSKKLEDVIKRIGNWIYNGDWQLGILIGLGLVFMLGFVGWKIKIGRKMERWRDRKEHG